MSVGTLQAAHLHTLVDPPQQKPSLGWGGHPRVMPFQLPLPCLVLEGENGSWSICLSQAHKRETGPPPFRPLVPKWKSHSMITGALMT